MTDVTQVPARGALSFVLYAADYGCPAAERFKLID